MERNLDKEIWGAGALNIDYFFEVEDLTKISFQNKSLTPGAEIWGSKKDFIELKKILKSEGKFLGKTGGGSAANTIYALKEWGFKCGFLGILGKDEEGDFLLSQLEEIDTSQILRDGYTGRCLIVLDQKRDRSIFVCPASGEKMYLFYRPSYPHKDWLHISSLISREGFSFHNYLVLQHKGTISFDPGEIYAQHGFKKLLPIFKKVHYIFITHQELRILQTSIEELLSLGIKMVALKKGRYGAEIKTLKESMKFLAKKVTPIIDNTGAGDVFNAGIIAGQLLNMPMRKRGMLAMKLAASSLKNYGRLGFPSKEEFLKYVKEIKGESSGT